MTEKAVDTAIHARWVLPMSGAQQLLEDHSLIVDRGVITDLGPSAEIRSRYQPENEYELADHVLLPGLINAHGHAPMSLFRGYADDLPLQAWLEQLIWPAEARWVSEDFVAAGARLAIAEMLLTGTTTFSDMYFFPDQVAAVASQAGIRVQLACPVLDFPTVWAANAEEYISKTTRLYDEYRNSERIRIAFGPHAPYTVSDEPLKKIAMLAEELDIGIHMHIHENAQEISDAMQHSGMRPLTRLKQLELTGPRLQAVHMTQITDDEIKLLAAQSVQVIHCPASNLKLASGFCPVSKLLDAGINVALGTDSCSSNNALDMLSELRLAALLHKGLDGNARSLPAIQALQMATINGARALGIEQQTGSLETGKQADVIALDLSAANTQPVYDPASTLAYSAQGRQVTHSWIQGQPVVLNGQLQTMHLEDILDEAKDWASRISSAQ